MSTGTTTDYAEDGALKIHPVGVFSERARWRQAYENNTLQFFNQPEGYVEPVSAGSTTFVYVYQYKDHLGNIRLSYKDISLTSTPSLQIQEENNYYPFGLKHKGYNSNIVSEHRWKYNGKELQNELDLNWYDLGARNLDHALGRFMNVDPKAEEYNFQSVYAFAANNPVLFIDINGEGVENDYGIDKRGNITLINRTNDKFDRLFVAKSDGKGNAVINKRGLASKVSEENIVVNNQDILPALSKSGPEINLGIGIGNGRLSTVSTSFDSKNDLFNVFKFATDNSDVEFSIAKLDFDGKNIYNLSTYHNTQLSPDPNGVSGGILKAVLHSHPNIQTYQDKIGKIDWQKSQLRSMGGDAAIVKSHQITYPYYVYFPQTKSTLGLKFNKNSYPNIETSTVKSFKF